VELEAQNRHPRRLSGHELTLTAGAYITLDQAGLGPCALTEAVQLVGERLKAA
jgi:hypothetical protein